MYAQSVEWHHTPWHTLFDCPKYPMYLTVCGQWDQPARAAEILSTSSTTESDYLTKDNMTRDDMMGYHNTNSLMWSNRRSKLVVQKPNVVMVMMLVVAAAAEEEEYLYGTIKTKSQCLAGIVPLAKCSTAVDRR